MAQPSARVLVAVLLLPGAAAGADWPTVRGDAARTGAVRAEVRLLG